LSGEESFAKINPVRKSLLPTGKQVLFNEGLTGASNPVFVPFRDKSLTGFAEKGTPTEAGLRTGLSNGVNKEDTP